MSFKEWLYDQLVNDSCIDEEEVSIDEISEDFLISCTDVDTYDIENYKSQFKEHCTFVGVNPIWDVE